MVSPCPDGVGPKRRLYNSEAQKLRCSPAEESTCREPSTRRCRFQDGHHWVPSETAVAVGVSTDCGKRRPTKVRWSSNLHNWGQGQPNGRVSAVKPRKSILSILLARVLDTPRTLSDAIKIPASMESPHRGCQEQRNYLQLPALVEGCLKVRSPVHSVK